jgi:hypothetical protein
LRVEHGCDASSRRPADPAIRTTPYTHTYTRSDSTHKLKLSISHIRVCGLTDVKHLVRQVKQIVNRSLRDPL